MRAVITGVATGPDGPVALARVMVAQSPAPMPDIAALTGEDGSFTIGTVGPGRYVVAVYADGYRASHAEVMVGPEDGAVEVRVQLETDPPRG